MVGSTEQSKSALLIIREQKREKYEAMVSKFPPRTHLY
jgi:hypothetical protein